MECDSRVLGYVSFTPDKKGIFCDGNACIIAGSEEKMKLYLISKGTDGDKFGEIKKTRFGEIWQGLSMGAVYQFDDESYHKLKAILDATGRNTQTKVDLNNPIKKDNGFYNVYLKGTTENRGV